VSCCTSHGHPGAIMPDDFSDVCADIFQEQGQHTCAASALAFHVPTIAQSIVAV
jgi:hypothetical protein